VKEMMSAPIFIFTALSLGKADMSLLSNSAVSSLRGSTNKTSRMLGDGNRTALQMMEMQSKAITNDDWWSSFLGGPGGEAGDLKVCPQGSFIAQLDLHEGNPETGNIGLSKIGQVTCSDGTQLPCCDGVGRYSDKQVSMKIDKGFDHAKVMVNSLVRGICFGEICAGTDGAGYSLKCPPGYAFAGFQTFRGVLVDSIRFMCRGEFNCGKMYPLDSNFCPKSNEFLPCGQAPLNTLCIGDGTCGSVTNINNCDGRSIYLKV